MPRIATTKRWPTSSRTVGSAAVVAARDVATATAAIEHEPDGRDHSDRLDPPAATSISHAHLA